MKAGPILRLIRLPNLFTAPVDSLAGWYLAGWLARRLDLAPHLDWRIGLLLAVASVGLYLGGIVLNDLLDQPVDALERPGRPLPSGSVSRRTAWSISALGFAIGAICSYMATGPLGLLVASLLGTLIAGYNARLKHFLIGPLAMGLCRGLNVLLGASATTDLGGPLVWTVAALITLFVAGITCISRSEARDGPSSALTTGLALEKLCWAPLFSILLVSHAWLRAGPSPTPRAWIWTLAGAVLFAAAWLPALHRAFLAWRDPTESKKQQAVKSGVLALPFLHAGIALAFTAWPMSLGLALLGLTARRIARWIYVT